MKMSSLIKNIVAAGYIILNIVKCHFFRGKIPHIRLYLVIALLEITVTSCKRQNYYVILLKNKNQ